MIYCSVLTGRCASACFVGEREPMRRPYVSTRETRMRYENASRRRVEFVSRRKSPRSASNSFFVHRLRFASRFVTGLIYGSLGNRGIHFDDIFLHDRKNKNNNKRNEENFMEALLRFKPVYSWEIHPEIELTWNDRELSALVRIRSVKC